MEKDLNVQIDDFGADAQLNSLVRGYHDLFTDYMAKTGQNGAIHIVGDYRKIM